jgi:general secretion pathway protein N
MAWVAWARRLNTVAPTGSMRLSWSTLELALEQRQFSAIGRTTLR